MYIWWLERICMIRKNRKINEFKKELGSYGLKYLRIKRERNGSDGLNLIISCNGNKCKWDR